MSQLTVKTLTVKKLVTPISSARGGSNDGVAEDDSSWTAKAKGLFEKYDTNGDGCMDEDELGSLLMAISDRFTKQDIKGLLAAADSDGNGHIEYHEFIDWVCGGGISQSRSASKRSASKQRYRFLGRAVTQRAQGLDLLFDVYDKDHTGSITTGHFQECHIILQAALRRANFDDDDERRNADIDLEKDKKDVLDYIAANSDSGKIGLLDFIDWMRRHIPEGMGQQDFVDFAHITAGILQESFAHEFCEEYGYIKEKAGCLNNLMQKVSASMELLDKSKKRAESKKSPWDGPPTGLSVDRLKAVHMMLVPINMRNVKDISWELLCLPCSSSDGDIWVAELVRRLLLQTGKVRVEKAEHYVFDLEREDWVKSDDAYSNTFEFINPGLGVYCLLKTAANFGQWIHWTDIQHSLEGAVDMRLIRDDDVEVFNEHITELVLEQMEEDNVKAGGSREDKLKYAKRYLKNEFQVHPGMVMATLLKLGIVTRDPAWEEFVADEEEEE